MTKTRVKRVGHFVFEAFGRLQRKDYQGAGNLACKCQIQGVDVIKNARGNHRGRSAQNRKLFEPIYRGFKACPFCKYMITK